MCVCIYLDSLALRVVDKDSRDPTNVCKTYKTRQIDLMKRRYVSLQAVTDAHGVDAHGVGANSAQPHGLG